MWKRIIDNCVTHIWEWVVLIIPTIISIFLAWYPDSKINLISTKIWISLLIILILSFFILLKALITTVNIAKEAIVPLPQLKLIKDGILIFTPSELFTTDSIAAIWEIDTIEKFIGYGIVETVNSQKYLQAKIDKYYSDYNIEHLKKNKSKIVLRPTIRKTDLIQIITSKEECND